MKTLFTLACTLLGFGLATAEDAWRPVYETIRETQVNFVDHQVTETVMKDCTTTVYQSVCETTWKEVCRTEHRWQRVREDREVCLHIAEKQTVMVPVCKRVPVTECKPCCEKSCIQLGGVSAGGGCENKCGSKHPVCDKVTECWQAFGDCLGNCGAKLGARYLNHSRHACCTGIRVPDRITACSVTRYEMRTEMVPICKVVRRDVTVKVPHYSIKRVCTTKVERVPVTVTRQVPQVVTKQVPTTICRTVKVAQTTCTPKLVCRLERVPAACNACAAAPKCETCNSGCGKSNTCGNGCGKATPCGCGTGNTCSSNKPCGCQTGCNLCQRRGILDGCCSSNSNPLHDFLRRLQANTCSCCPK